MYVLIPTVIGLILFFIDNDTLSRIGRMNLDLNWNLLLLVIILVIVIFIACMVWQLNCPHVVIGLKYDKQDKNKLVIQNCSNRMAVKILDISATTVEDKPLDLSVWQNCILMPGQKNEYKLEDKVKGKIKIELKYIKYGTKHGRKYKENFGYDIQNNDHSLTSPPKK